VRTRKYSMPTVIRNGTSIYCKVTGTGPAVVLGHSFLCSGEMWNPQIQSLARHHTVVNIDLRGHGRSGAIERRFDLCDLVKDVVAVLDHLEIDRAVWAGLSIGGMVALRAALYEKDRVSGLILLDTHAGSETPGKKLRYQAMVEFGKVFGTAPLVPQIARMFFCHHTHRTNPELVGEWRERFRSVRVSTVVHTASALRRRDSVVDRLGEIDIPVLVIVGEADQPTPPAYAREIVNALPRASLVEVKKAGHLSNLEQPAAVSSAMMTYLESMSG